MIGARDPDFILAIKDTLIFTIATVFLETVIGIGFAMLVNANFPGRGAMRALMLVPWAIPTAISSRAWEWMFNSTRVGFFNALFDMFGIGDGHTAFLQLDTWQLPAMIVIDVWKTTPFMTLLALAGLQLIPASIYEAADSDYGRPDGRCRKRLNLGGHSICSPLACVANSREYQCVSVRDVEKSDVSTEWSPHQMR